MISVFKNKDPRGAVLLLLYAFVLKFHLFTSPKVPVLKETDGFLFRSIVNYLADLGGGSPWLFSLIAFLLLFFQAVHLNKISSDMRLFARPNLLPGMAYLLLTGIFPEWQGFSAALLVNSLLIWAMGKMMALYNTPSPRTQLFNMGMLVGFASFLFFPSAAFLLVVFFALLVMRPFHLSEWLITIMGILAPVYFLFVYQFLTDRWDPTAYYPGIEFSIPSFKPGLGVAAGISAMVMPFLMGGYLIQGQLGKMLIQVRKCWSLVLFYTLASTLIPFINNLNDLSNWLLCAIPFSLFFAAFSFYSNNRWVPALIHWLVFVWSIYVAYF